LTLIWNDVVWDSHPNDTGAIVDMGTMLDKCHKNRVPVAVELSKKGTVGRDNYLFALINKWEQERISPSRWKITAEFEEFV
jgi:hypothetical protein